MKFLNDPFCSACPLHKGATNVCVPSVTYHHGTPGQRALLCIGQNPGFHEDQERKPFVGKSGKNLKLGYIRPIIARHPDVTVYLTNTIRCGPEPATSVSLAKTCWPLFNGPDIQKIVNAHSETFIWLLGGAATQAFGHIYLNGSMTLRSAMSRQPFEITLYGKRIIVFATYHPVLRDRSVISSLSDHVGLVVSFLSGDTCLLPGADGTPSTSKLEPTLISMSKMLQLAPTELAIDVETYGAVLTQPGQTQFNPTLARVKDGCAVGDLVQTVAFTDTATNQTSVTPYQTPTQRKAVRTLIEGCTDLVTQSGPYDLNMLRACDPGLETTLKPLSKTIHETILLSALDNPDRPEIGLDALCRVLNIGRIAKPLKDGHRFKGPTDPALLKYNARDTHATALVRRKLLARVSPIARSEFATQFRSGLVWYVSEMTRNGICYHRPWLRDLGAVCKDQMLLCRGKISLISPVGPSQMIVQGKGSDKSQRFFLEQCVSQRIREHPLFRVTPTRGVICRDIANRRLIASDLPHHGYERAVLTLLNIHESAKKIVTSQVNPLMDKWLVGTDRAICYPSWFMAPSAFKDNEGDIGGTAQSRLAASSPAEQTRPLSVATCRCSRYKTGFLFSFDLSQIEMRVAGVLSGDQYIRSAYVGDNPMDMHADLAVRVEGTQVLSNPHWGSHDNTKDPRQAFKTMRFLAQYGGGWKQAMRTLLIKLGVVYDQQVIMDTIAMIRGQQRTWFAWCDKQAQIALKDGKITLAITGQRRWIDGHEQARVAGNFPVQVHASNICHAILIELLRRVPRACLICVNTHDAGTLDCPGRYETRVRECLEDAVNQVRSYDGYWGKLLDHYNSDIPLEFGVEISGRPGLDHPSGFAGEEAPEIPGEPGDLE